LRQYPWSTSTTFGFLYNSTNLVRIAIVSELRQVL